MAPSVSQSIEKHCDICERKCHKDSKKLAKWSQAKQHQASSKQRSKLHKHDRRTGWERSWNNLNGLDLTPHDIMADLAFASSSEPWLHRTRHQLVQVLQVLSPTSSCLFSNSIFHKISICFIVLLGHGAQFCPPVPPPYPHKLFHHRLPSQHLSYVSLSYITCLVVLHLAPAHLKIQRNVQLRSVRSTSCQGARGQVECSRNDQCQQGQQLQSSADRTLPGNTLR